MTPPVFGQDRDPGIVASLSPFPCNRRKRAPLSGRPNPMVIALGPGPEGRTCGDCRHLVVKHDHGHRRYYGCELRGPLTSGPGTDHLVRWPACASFAQEPGE